MMATAPTHTPYVICVRIALMGRMKTLCFVSITSVSPTNGSAPTNVAFRSPGSVTCRTTVTITRTKTARTVPAGPAGLATSSAPTATASLRYGSVTWTTTAETTQTSPCRNAWAPPIAVITIRNSAVKQTTAASRSGPCAMASTTAGTTVTSRTVSQ